MILIKIIRGFIRALREKFNQALEKLRTNGTLKKIAIKYFGEDITS